MLAPAGSDPLLVTVAASVPEKEPNGKTNIRVTFNETLSFPGVTVTRSHLLRTIRSTRLYSNPADQVIASNFVHLDTVHREIAEGDWVVLESPKNTPTRQLLQITRYQELLWYSNAPSTAAPGTPPDPTVNPPIAVPHTYLEFTPAIDASAAAVLNTNRSSLLLRYAWVDVGQLSGTALSTVTGQVNLSDQPSDLFAVGSLTDVLVEDSLGAGSQAQAGNSSASGPYLNNFEASPVALKTPLSVLFNLMTVSRGKTVLNEVLGSGSASLPNQEFVLQKFPLTYLLSSGSDGSYKSTLRVWVNGIEWIEVPNFFAQPPNAQVFVTREDDAQKNARPLRRRHQRIAPADRSK